MSAPQPLTFGGLARLFTHTIARYKDTDGSINLYEFLAVAITYSNKNPNAVALRNRLKVRTNDAGVQDVATPLNTTINAVIGWNIDAFIADTDYPSFLLTSKPAFTAVSTTFETFDVTVNQYEGYLILFRNISNINDQLTIKVDTNEYRIGLPAGGNAKGELQLCFINRSASPRRYVFQWRSDNGVIEKAIAPLSGVSNFNQVAIVIDSFEVDSAGNPVSETKSFSESLMLISIQFV